MVLRREADAVGVAVPPRDRLDRVLRIADLRPQHRPRAHALAGSAFERRHRRPRTRHAEVRVSAGLNRLLGRFPGVNNRSKRVLTQRDLLAGNIVLIAARAVVEPGHPGIGRGPLRPVQPPVLDEDLLGRVVAGRQPDDHRVYRSTRDVHGHDARGVVAFARRAAHSLVGVGRIQCSVTPAMLEREPDRGPVRLEAAARRGGLPDRTADLVAVPVEDQDVRRERVVRIKLGEQTWPWHFRHLGIVIAPTRQAGSRFEH